MAARYLPIKKNSISQSTFANFSVELQPISLCCCMPRPLAEKYDLPQWATMHPRLGVLQWEEEILAEFNKDDGMEESISGAGLGQVFQL